eukprot:s188_g1.t1
MKAISGHGGARLLNLPRDAPGDQVESLVKLELVDWQLEPRHATKVLSLLARAGRVRVCRHVLQAMRRGQVQTNLFHYSAGISACELSSAWYAAIDMVSALPSMRLMPDIVVLNTAASACGQPGRWQPALHLFGSVVGMDLEADIISFNASLGACGTAGRWREAAGLLFAAAVGAVKASPVTLNATIDACAQQWDTALELLESMRQSLLEATCISFNSTINACEKGAAFSRPDPHCEMIRDDIRQPSSLSDWPRATFLLDAMRQTGLLPDIFGFNSAVSTCEKAAAGWEVPLQLLQQMEDDLRVAKDVVSFSSTISAHEKVGLWEASLGLLWQLPKAEVSPNCFTFNAAGASETSAASFAMSGYCGSVCLESVRVRADVVTYNALLRTACIDDDLEEELQKLVEQAVKPNMVSYGTVLDLCRTYGRWKRGLHVMDSLRWKQVARDVVSFNSLLASCRGKQWQIAQKLLDEMIREELAPNARISGLK